MNSDPLVGCTVDLERTVIAVQYQRHLRNHWIGTISGRSVLRFEIRISDATELLRNINFTENRTCGFYEWTQHFKEVVFCRI